jgi:hypothetical protein
MEIAVNTGTPSPTLPITRKRRADAKIDLPRALSLRFDNGLSLHQIADIFDCAHSSVWEALKPYEPIALGKVKAQLPAVPDWRARLFDAARIAPVISILDPKNADKLENTGVLNKMATAEKADKMYRLEKGQATTITEHTGVDIDVNILNILNGK